MKVDQPGWHPASRCEGERTASHYWEVKERQHLITGRGGEDSISLLGGRAGEDSISPLGREEGRLDPEGGKEVGGVRIYRAGRMPWWVCLNVNSQAASSPPCVWKEMVQAGDNNMNLF